MLLQVLVAFANNVSFDERIDEMVAKQNTGIKRQKE